MTILLPLFRIVSGAPAGAAAGGAGNRPGSAATTADLDADQATPVATTIGANTNLRPALTSAGRKLTAKQKPAVCDFQLVVRIRGEMGGLYD
jgi:hypothetical protein